MRKLASVTFAVVLCLALAGRASAAEPAPKAAAEPAAKPAASVTRVVNVGDTVFVCGCGPECKCTTIQAGPGKCGCGKDLVKASVTKVEGDRISVQIADAKGEQVFKAPYKCGCPKEAGCKCTPAALGPGKCGCGKELVKNQ